MRLCLEGFEACTMGSISVATVSRASSISTSCANNGFFLFSASAPASDFGSGSGSGFDFGFGSDSGFNSGSGSGSGSCSKLARLSW